MLTIRGGAGIAAEWSRVLVQSHLKWTVPSSNPAMGLMNKVEDELILSHVVKNWSGLSHSSRKAVPHIAKLEMEDKMVQIKKGEELYIGTHEEFDLFSFWQFQSSNFS